MKFNRDQFSQQRFRQFIKERQKKQNLINLERHERKKQRRQKIKDIFINTCLFVQRNSPQFFLLGFGFYEGILHHQTKNELNSLRTDIQ